jgi:hypothetical protein
MHLCLGSSAHLAGKQDLTTMAVSTWSVRIAIIVPLAAATPDKTIFCPFGTNATAERKNKHTPAVEKRSLSNK